MAFQPCFPCAIMRRSGKSARIPKKIPSKSRRYQPENCQHIFRKNFLRTPLRLNDFELAVSRPRPPQYPLRLGDGRRDLLHRLDHRRHRRRTRRVHRAAAEGIRLDHRGDFLGAVDPLHPVRADGPIRRSTAEPLRPAQRHADSVAGRGLRPPRIAGDDQGLASDAAVGRRDRHRYRHDRPGAGRHHRRALVRGAAWPCGRHSHRQRRHRATGVPAAAGDPDRSLWLADRAGPGLRRAGRGGLRRADDHARPAERPRPAAVRR